MNAYPVHIGRIDDLATDTEACRSLLGGPEIIHCPCLGEVNIGALHGQDPIVSELTRRSAAYGFKANKVHPGPYNVRDYTYGAGAVGVHVDSGFGFAAAALMAVAPLSDSLDASDFDLSTDCQFVSRGKVISLQVGDAFIFNGDVEHAWLANCRWLIAVQSLSKTRKKVNP